MIKTYICEMFSLTFQNIKIINMVLYMGSTHVICACCQIHTKLKYFFIQTHGDSYMGTYGKTASFIQYWDGPHVLQMNYDKIPKKLPLWTGWVQNSQNEIQTLFQDFSSTWMVKFKPFHTSILWYQYSIEIKF